MRVRGVMKTAEDMKCFIPTFIQWILASQDEKHTQEGAQNRTSETAYSNHQFSNNILQAV